MDSTFSTHGRVKNSYKIFVENHKGEDYLA